VSASTEEEIFTSTAELRGNVQKWSSFAESIFHDQCLTGNLLHNEKPVVVRRVHDVNRKKKTVGNLARDQLLRRRQHSWREDRKRERRWRKSRWGSSQE